MIYLQAQALDNVSPDECVLDGTVHDSSAPEVEPVHRLTSRLRLHGQESLTGQTRIWRLGDDVSVELASPDHDALGRPAPLVATFPWIHLERPDEVVAELAAYAALLERTFDQAAVTADLDEWRRGKATGGRLRRALRACRRAWRGSRRWLRRHSRLSACGRSAEAEGADHD